MQIVTYVTYKKSANGTPPPIEKFICNTMIFWGYIKCISENKMQNGSW